MTNTNDSDLPMATELTVTVTGIVRACAELAMPGGQIRWLAIFESTGDATTVTAYLDPEHFPDYDTPEALQGETLRLVDAVAPVIGGVVTVQGGKEYLHLLDLDGTMTWEPTYEMEGIDG